jgi:hypothetical protein
MKSGRDLSRKESEGSVEGLDDQGCPYKTRRRGEAVRQSGQRGGQQTSEGMIDLDPGLGRSWWTEGLDMKPKATFVMKPGSCVRKSGRRLLWPLELVGRFRMGVCTGVWAATKMASCGAGDEGG